MGEGSRELTQQATNLHVRPPFCELRYTDVHKRVTDIKQNGVVCSPKCMFFAEYSLVAMFDTYPASKCTTQNMYTRICAGLVAIVSLRTALGSLKEERKKERKKKTKTNNLRGRRFRFTTLETSVSRAKGIFKLRKFA